MIPSTLLPAVLLLASHNVSASAMGPDWLFFEVCHVKLTEGIQPAVRLDGIWIKRNSALFVIKAPDAGEGVDCSYLGFGTQKIRVKGNPAWVKKQMEGNP